MSLTTDKSVLGDFLAAVTLVCPNFGGSMPDPSNNATWQIFYNPAANTSQLAAAQNVINTFDAADDAAAIASWANTFTSDSNLNNLATIINTYSATQIDTWLTNNVTNLAQALPVLGAIIKYIVSKES